MRCSHFDAFRFFTAAGPPAEPAHARPGRRSTRIEQPGCLHANMDLYKWAYKLSPLVSSRAGGRRFDLAREIRTLDMRASPYDLAALGLSAGARGDPGGPGRVRGGAAGVRRAGRRAARPAARRRPRRHCCAVLGSVAVGAAVPLALGLALLLGQPAFLRARATGGSLGGAAAAGRRPPAAGRSSVRGPPPGWPAGPGARWRRSSAPRRPGGWPAGPAPATAATRARPASWPGRSSARPGSRRCSHPARPARTSGRSAPAARRRGRPTGRSPAVRRPRPEANPRRPAGGHRCGGSLCVGDWLGAGPAASSSEPTARVRHRAEEQQPDHRGLHGDARRISDQAPRRAPGTDLLDGLVVVPPASCPGVRRPHCTSDDQAHQQEDREKRTLHLRQYPYRA